ncbi:unnamed protein product [Miscanthus lutarioriparius]|uniref:DUF4408 domain-containing protein n=1 Tax=Miscanthus lutarioriparius TaxID=422564 RepID=A0A811RWN2_9POAL|nr:unnamed protein product [Miscanthus lutarioriparius]
MDSADAATPLGAWAWIRGYFTPATLFLVVNLVIGTIALTSRATQQRRRREHYYHDDAHGHHLQEEPLHPQIQQPGYGHYYHPEQTLYAPPPAPAPLARTSSVLDRLRSLGLYRFRSGDFPPEYGAAAAAAAPNYAQDVSAPVEEEETTATAHYARSRSEPAPAAREDERRPAPAPAPLRVKKSGSEVRKSQVARAAPRTVEAVAENDDSVEEAVGGFRRGPSPLQQEYHYQEEYVPPPARARAPAPVPLQRTSSVLDRLRSFGLYGFLAPDQPAAASVPASDGFATPADEKRHAHYDRSRSEPAPEQGKKEKKQEAKSRMAKSGSETRKTPAPRPVEAGGECVDARAEAFIDSFRQQQQVVHHHQYQEEEYVPPPAPAPPLSRTSSVLDRLRSFGLYRFRSGDLGPDLPSAAGASTETDEEEKQQAAGHYGRSRSEPAREQGKKKQEARMSKSSSSGVVEEAETEQCVDARADDFINKFRQQLQLQRLNSLLNYKEMLNRGGGGKQ